MIPVAYLGPPGTYSEMAAQIWSEPLQQRFGQPVHLQPYNTIVKALHAVWEQETRFAVVPVENSIEGGVTVTLDTLWQLQDLHIQEALILPILHSLVSHSPDLATITRIYSHPQALSQCQFWVEEHLPQAQCIPQNSTVEALKTLASDSQAAVISSRRAANLYQCPILRYPIGDHPDNCTRFWLVSLDPSPGGQHTSLGFTLPANEPGSLVEPLQILAQRGINLSRIESRPTKRSLGDYLFFVDIEANIRDASVLEALTNIDRLTEVIRVLGSYDLLTLKDDPYSETPGL